MRALSCTAVALEQLGTEGRQLGADGRRVHHLQRAAEAGQLLGDRPRRVRGHPQPSPVSDADARSPTPLSGTA